MTVRSDAHQCEVCGTYGFHGFKQTNGDYHWYCLVHRGEGYKLRDLSPPVDLPGQMSLFGGTNESQTVRKGQSRRR